MIDNPFAFPCGYHPSGNSADQGGMTLRDYFAGKAMQALIVKAEPPDEQGPSAFASALADASFLIADAMLAGRVKIDGRAE